MYITTIKKEYPCHLGCPINLFWLVDIVFLPFTDLLFVNGTFRETIFYWFWIWIIQLQRLWHWKSLQWICRLWLRLQLVCHLTFLHAISFFSFLQWLKLIKLFIVQHDFCRYPTKDEQYHFYRHYLAPDKPHEVCKMGSSCCGSFIMF